MKITDSYLTQVAEFEKAQITVPKYDDAKVKENTLSAPRWVHFGGGHGSALHNRIMLLR